MKQNIKNFNFCNFNLKQSMPCVNKNELSVFRHYNLNFGGQVIKSVSGFKEFLISHFNSTTIATIFHNYPEFENKFIQIYLYEFYDRELNDDKTLIFAINNEFELYEISLENLQILSLNISFQKLPVAFQNNEKFYFYSESDKFLFFDKSDTYVVVSNFVDFQDFVYYQDKLFFVTKNNIYKIFYTEKIDIENIDESLSLYDNVSLSDNDGKILKIVKFKGALFVIQQYAISKLSGSEGNYYFSSNCSINSRIFENSIGLLNDYIIFYTSSGMYLFDGNEIKQIFSSVTYNYVVDENIMGCVFNNKYYILTGTKIDGTTKKVVAEFDISTNSCTNYYLSGLEKIRVISTPSCYELVVLTKKNNKYYIYVFDNSNSSEGYYLKTNSICFDDEKLKSISAVKIIGDGCFNLKISSEKMSKTLSISGNTEFDNLGICGYLFDIEIYGSDSFELKSMIFSVESIQK